MYFGDWGYFPNSKRYTYSSARVFDDLSQLSNSNIDGHVRLLSRETAVELCGLGIFQMIDLHDKLITIYEHHFTLALTSITQRKYHHLTNVEELSVQPLLPPQASFICNIVLDWPYRGKIKILYCTPTTVNWEIWQTGTIRVACYYEVGEILLHDHC